jgi:MFS family permease
MARARSTLPATVILLGMTSLFTDVGTEMIFPLLPVFLVETLGAGPTYLGLVEGAANTVASVLKLGSGFLSDLVPRRKPLVLFGYGIASLARPFFAVATRPWHALAVRLVDRVGKGVRGSPRDALIADAAGDRLGRSFGFNQAMDNVGAVLGPLLATLLIAAKMSVHQVFLIAVIPGFVATACVAFVREPPRVLARRAEASDPRVKSPTLDPQLVPSVGIVAVFSLGNSSDAFLLLRARSLGLSAAALPILWSVLNLSKVVFSYLGGNLADRRSRPKLIVWGWLVYAVVYLGLGAAKAPWQVWWLFAVYGIFYGLTEPVEKALLTDLAPAVARGRAFGIYNFIVGIASMPAGLITGALWNRWGATVALDAAAGFAGVACLSLLAWDLRRARVAPINTRASDMPLDKRANDASMDAPRRE